MQPKDLNVSKHISVVIASLGGAILRETIGKLNSGTVIPDEILICTPSDYLKNISWVLPPNTRIIRTECHGQVQQRIEGLKAASGQLVMQLDDDIFFHSNCLEILVNTISPNSKWAIAPSFVSTVNGKSIYKLAPNKNFLFTVFYYLMNGRSGYVAGKVLSSGIGIGVDLEIEQTETVKVDWLAGGCILHHKNNLVLKDYYPLKGKAYCEDLIHSYLLKEAGVNLFISTQAIAEIIPNKSIFELNIKAFIEHIKGEYQSRKYFQFVSKRSLWRMRIYYVIVLVLYVSQTSLRNLKNEIFKN